MVEPNILGIHFPLRRSGRALDEQRTEKDHQGPTRALLYTRFTLAAGMNRLSLVEVEHRMPNTSSLSLPSSETWEQVRRPRQLICAHGFPAGRKCGTLAFSSFPPCSWVSSSELPKLHLPWHRVEFASSRWLFPLLESGHSLQLKGMLGMTFSWLWRPGLLKLHPQVGVRHGQESQGVALRFRKSCWLSEAIGGPPPP